ncbi:hypothetical protein OIE67_21240 [Nonomuraea fuscirosea]|uniref:hypothetical protein n=1 Tax=Nonomuraea fuscirosea TaxID=1291556 RepID=UPI002DD8A0E1|nr:hypothetical protein [Nonomuraea fuscirosea]WSA57043.1 hypothetical protein OIE67_21240 [Nonomuraea fuscirosea]
MIGLVIDPDGISRTVELPRDPADRAAMIATLTGTNTGGQAVRVAIELARCPPSSRARTPPPPRRTAQAIHPAAGHPC